MGIKAVHFDGATYLSNSGLLTLPSSSPHFFMSYWYRAVPEPPYPASLQMILNVNGSSATDGYAATVQHADDVGNGPKLFVFFGAPNGTDWISFESENTLPYDGNWHHVMVSLVASGVNADGFNTSTGVMKLDGVDRVSDGFSLNKFQTINPSVFVWDLGWTNVSSWSIGGPTTVGGEPANAYMGDLAELFFLAGTKIDITDPDVRAKFIGPDTLLPVAIDAGGLWPFFDSLGVVPQIWLSGNQDLFPRNYPGWSATCVSQTDSDPTSQFAVAAGNLTTADDDPFGQSGTARSFVGV